MEVMMPLAPGPAIDVEALPQLRGERPHSEKRLLVQARARSARDLFDETTTRKTADDGGQVPSGTTAGIDGLDVVVWQPPQDHWWSDIDSSSNDSHTPGDEW